MIVTFILSFILMAALFLMIWAAQVDLIF